MVGSEPLPDYYAELQVSPGADAEVIEAAYRQLMKKHHPDIAGSDPRRMAAHHARSIALNQAFSVLRDPEQRRRYDAARERSGTRRPTESAHPRSAPATGRPHSEAAVSAPPRRPQTAAPPPHKPRLEEITAEAAAPKSPWLAPLAALSAAYYLLPGSYEWEAGRRKELLAVVALPVLGIAAFCLATGRLTPIIGGSLNAKLLDTWRVVADRPLRRVIARG